MFKNTISNNNVRKFQIVRCSIQIFRNTLAAQQVGLLLIFYV